MEQSPRVRQLAATSTTDTGFSSLATLYADSIPVTYNRSTYVSNLQIRPEDQHAGPRASI